MRNKIEFLDPKFSEKIFEAIALGGKVEFVSRSLGSGETVHGWIKMDGVLRCRRTVGGPVEAITEESIADVLQLWNDKLCSVYDPATKSFPVIPIEHVRRTRSGLLPFYIRATIPETP